MTANISSFKILSRNIWNRHSMPGPLLLRNGFQSAGAIYKSLLYFLFVIWTSSPLLKQPGGPFLLGGDHIDAKLSADTRSA